MCVGNNKVTIFPFSHGIAGAIVGMLRSDGFTEEEARLGSTKKYPSCVVTTGRATDCLRAGGYSSIKGTLIERPVEAGGGFD